ncbi:DUF4179 domain-containing protein [Paenibacillus jilunlii]|uniref:DUF4179 domain-containing protein n=1 Tax=Paenibacillus jilunlii TaxID=682956 RepID=A0A1G9WBN6_9BACL|nr:DUF4179 domain-containing protein [Paenibacillus jilunlii]KWX73469.1 hypothetical protein AML91_17445 [Paenibacillus jilunlii]SDM81879.1 protein of unknown function [Paenibacillus jilunlii]
MEKWQGRTESRKMEDIRQMVQNHEMPVESFSDLIMKRIGEENMEKRASAKRGGRFLKKTLVATSTAAVLGAGIIGSGFVSPVMADTLKQIPIVGNIFKDIEDKGLQVAGEKGLSTAPNQSVSHDGVTLKLTDIYYDGTRLALAIEREGIDNDETMAKQIIEPIEFDPAVKEKKAKVTLDQSVKGLLGSAVIKMPDGKEVAYGMSMSGDVEGKKNTLLYDFRKLSNTEGYGNEFELSVSIPVTQIAEPFEFKVPVKKVTEGIVKLDLNQTKKTQEFSYTIKKLELTPATSRLVVNEAGKVPSLPKPVSGYNASEMLYDIVGDQSNNVLSQQGYFYSPLVTTHPIVDLDFEPFPKAPKTITVKPFTHAVDKDLKPLKDADGKPVKHYYPELEQTIQIP